MSSLVEKTLKPGAGEMAQSIKCVPHKHEDTSLYSQYTHKSQTTVVLTYKPRVEEAEPGEVQGGSGSGGHHCPCRSLWRRERVEKGSGEVTDLLRGYGKYSTKGKRGGDCKGEDSHVCE